MPTEIERKFVLPAVPSFATSRVGTSMRQGYLAQQDSVEVRVRISNGSAILTVKGGSGLIRTEVEVPVSLEQAEALWPLTKGRRIEKTRYRVDVGEPNDSGLDMPVAEVDVYAGDLRGLCTAEVEFSSADHADAFVSPSWMGRDVTGDVRWSNAHLAVNGRPDA